MSLFELEKKYTLQAKELQTNGPHRWTNSKKVPFLPVSLPILVDGAQPAQLCAMVLTSFLSPARRARKSKIL